MIRTTSAVSMLAVQLVTASQQAAFDNSTLEASPSKTIQSGQTFEMVKGHSGKHRNLPVEKKRDIMFRSE